MSSTQKRIVSLLPGTTEIVAALGFEKQLAGRSHECDIPTSVQNLPACTQPKFKPHGQSYEIDQRVKALLQEGLSVYRVDAQKLAELNPDIIITQDHCEVCAVSVDTVKAATRQYLNNDVNIISVSPTTLEQVYNSVKKIASALDHPAAAKQLIRSMQAEFDNIHQETNPFAPKDILCIEWLDPLMTAGNWVPQLADIANVNTLAAKAGAHSPWIDWQQILELDADIICLMPCGYSINKTLAETELLTSRPEWNKLKAVQNGHVYIADGHHYFNRPGPRLTDSSRILAEIAHPLLESTFQNKGWIRFNNKLDSNLQEL